MRKKKAYTHYIKEKRVLSDAEVAWIELPETYRYQRLFEKAYLVNEKGEMEREAVEILLEDGKPIIVRLTSLLHQLVKTQRKINLKVKN